MELDNDDSLPNATDLSSTTHPLLELEELCDLMMILEETSDNSDKNHDSSVTKTLELFGVAANKSDDSVPTNTWKRCLVPSSLYSLPYLPPQTTLVPLSFVPQPLRENCVSGIKNHDTSTTKEDFIVVEIPISSLHQEVGTNQQQQQQQDHQPLKLYNPKQDYFGPSKLQDYFTYSKNTTSSETSSRYTNPEALKQSRNVLLNHMSDMEAYQTGLLLTKPPGVSQSYIGVTPQLVYPQLLLPTTPATITNQPLSSIPTPKDANTTYATPSGGLWDTVLLADDDDSIFGNSSSSDSSTSSQSLVSDGDTSQEEDEDDTHNIESPSPFKEITPNTLVVDDEDPDALLLDSLLLLDDDATYSSTHKGQRNNFPAASITSLKKKPSTSWAITMELDVNDFYTRVVPNPAMTFPFELDNFQKQAVARLERKESIFVSAHTSAGKTVCAEYAIALSQKRCTRTIYTSPIKALSNQKFRDFSQTFGVEEIGLITGDAQVNPAAPCLIMTTEILRSMLYRGADLVRDLEFVVFDECHYVNDMERGVVWEEVIIMLPDYVQLVFLSATTPNAIEFCDWIGRTKRRPIYVIRTNYRPVPLMHHLYTPANGGNKKLMHIIMEGDTKSKSSGFLSKGYSEATKAMLPSAPSSSSTKNGKSSTTGANNQKGKINPPKQALKTGSKQSVWQNQGSRSEWTTFVRFLEREEFTPSVIFSFSKKKCEEIALSLRSLDLNTAAERAAVTSFTEHTIKRLSVSDATLPQVIGTCEMVKRGIATHHGGLLPLLKEMVEILFSRNLIKVLFATETFAMGVNMPARSVVFSSIRKHDGLQFRELLPGEYIQMSGRAGRRGLDKVGTVIITCFGEEPPPQHILTQMLTGTSTKLQSQFRLTYNMILNLLRVEDMSVEDMIKRSFSEFAAQRALVANNYPKLLARGKKLLAKLEDEHQFQTEEGGSIIGAQDIEEYFALSSQLLYLNYELQSHILLSPGSGGGGALAIGRVVLVTSARRHGYVAAPGIVLRPPSPSSSSASKVSSQLTSSTTGESSSSLGKLYQHAGFNPAVCLVLLPFDFRINDAKSSVVSNEIGTLNYVGLDSSGRYYAIHEVELTEIFLVSDKKLSIDSKAIFKDSLSIPKESADSPGLPADSFFGKARPAKRMDDTFTGMVPRGKLKGSGAVDNAYSTFSKKGVSLFDPSQYHRHVDKIISLLLDVEAMESSSSSSPLSTSLDSLDLRSITPGVQKGEDYLLYRASCDRMEELLRKCRSCRSYSHPNILCHYIRVERKELLRARVNQLQKMLSNESLSLFPDFMQRKAVLQTLGYIDSITEAVCLKGRIACEVNTCESLVVAELVLDGILNELEPAEIVAVLSSLIAQEKTADEEETQLSELPKNLIRCCNRIKSIAYNFGALQKHHGLLVDPGDYVDGLLKFGLVQVVYEWALGVPFCNICELTMIQEGSIVRCITRLDELCREVRNCARVAGNPALYQKMEAASAAIKRDIVFASSLYVY